jgi:hypothetical protein
MDLLVDPEEVFIEFSKQLVQELNAESLAGHVCLDLLNETLRLHAVELLPSLHHLTGPFNGWQHALNWQFEFLLLTENEELNALVILVALSVEGSQRVHISPIRNDMSVWLERADQIGDERLGVVLNGWRWDAHLVAIEAETRLGQPLGLNHVVVLHEDLGFVSEVLGHQDSPLVDLLIFKLKDEVESGDLLLDILVVKPSNLIQILLREESVDDTSAKFGFSIWEIPL